MTPIISVTGYSKRYGETLAVEDLSLDVAAGSILGMFGPNGAGKTTTLRAMAGILQPTPGGFRSAGTILPPTPIAAKQQLAFVPDDPRLFDSLTVWEHLEFIAAAYRVEAFDTDGESLLEQFELTEKRNTVARELSRGMRQKVAICCAYLHRPAAVLFDEPLTGLDPRGIRTLKDSIRERAADRRGGDCQFPFAVARGGPLHRVADHAPGPKPVQRYDGRRPSRDTRTWKARIRWKPSSSRPRRRSRPQEHARC